jgi:WD40 repeat protein
VSGEAASGALGSDAETHYRAAASLSQDGRYAAIVVSGTQASLIDCSTGNVIESEYSDTDRPFVAIALSRTGRELAVATGREIVVRDCDTFKVRRTLPIHGAVHTMTFSCDEEALAVARTDGEDAVAVYDLESGNGLLDARVAAGETVSEVQFSVNGRNVFATTHRGANESHAIYSWGLMNGAQSWRKAKLAQSDIFVTSPDGGRLAIGGSELDFRDAFKGDAIATYLRGPDGMGAVQPLAYSRDGKSLAVTCGWGVHIWQHAGGDSVGIDLACADIIDGAFSDDGTRFTTLSSTNGIEVWDLAARNRLRHLPLHIYTR